MQITEMKINDIIPYEKNPRVNEGAAVKKVAKSIEQFGFKVPMVLDKDNVIITGHTRYKAALLLGMETVPVIVAKDFSPKQIKAYRIRWNNTALMKIGRAHV